MWIIIYCVHSGLLVGYMWIITLFTHGLLGIHVDHHCVPPRFIGDIHVDHHFLCSPQFILGIHVDHHYPHVSPNKPLVNTVMIHMYPTNKPE
jgi:hypothetical protein